LSVKFDLGKKQQATCRFDYQHLVLERWYTSISYSYSFMSF